ncbi:MAG: hypothetical protein GPJ51_07235 [Candidatus Heimdallarchaeota archaeon]|nr:hypothetical protein [Candidatus Heimdallarchaeota archaeon]
MDEALFIAIAALFISVLGFYYQYLRKGKILFGEPNMHFLWRDEEDFCIAFPLALTNSGSYSHTVNYLTGTLISLSNDKKFEFQVSKFSEGFSIDSEETITEFVGIGVEPRSSVTKLISFRAKKYIPDGEYVFELSGCLDGSTYITENLLSFQLEIDKEVRRGLIPDKKSAIHHYEHETLKQMSKKKKRRYYIILWGLRILNLILIMGFFNIILISNYTNKLQNPVIALIILLALSFLCALTWMTYEGLIVQTARKTIKQTKERGKFR